MTDVEIIAAIRGSHLKVNIAEYERDLWAAVLWDRAHVDVGSVLFGPGPYLHVPIEANGEHFVVRVYPTARLRRRLEKAWGRI